MIAIWPVVVLCVIIVAMQAATLMALAVHMDDCKYVWREQEEKEGKNEA